MNAQAMTAGAASREHLIEGTPLHPARRGATLWFTGLPSAGKSTIAHALAHELYAAGERVQVLDGDDVRPGRSDRLQLHGAQPFLGWMVMTCAISVTGCPVLALPCGFTREDTARVERPHG